uniref:ATP-binding response regulator n=1 Tax=Bacteroides ovatus TaxID=28116 RepID=UPI00359C9D07
MIQAKLKLEIIAGYLLLVSFFAFIIYLIHEEREKKSSMECQKMHWLEEQRLTNQTFIKMLNLATTGELIAGWTEEDYTAYQNKCMEAISLLQKLKMNQGDMDQRSCIDSVCGLLTEKERQMAALLHQLEDMPNAGEIIHMKIPAIVRKTRQQSKGQTSPMAAPTELLPTKKKKNNFWSFFKKKEEKSAYARQREKTIITRTPPTVRENPVVSQTWIYSLEKEINDTTRLYEEKLFAKIDSLKVQNRRLNERINTLIENFEKKEGQTFSHKIQEQQVLHNRSFQLITGIGIGAFLLVIILYMVIHRDVNRQYHYRRRLEASNKENTELLAARRKMMLSIAHDLRSPLAIIKESSELLPRLEEKAKCDEFAMNIHHSSDYMLSLVNTLMEFYMLDTEQIRLRPVFFLLSAFFKETAQNYTLLSKKRHIGFTTRFSGLDVIVNGDRAHLQQIINNLLSNALKFTEKGFITLDAEYKNEELCFLVRDSGTGMTEEEKKRIFNAFERLDNARNIPGFGLGLAITAKLIKQMNGEISVESHIGRGSTFSVFLPLPVADNNSDLEEVKLVTGYHLENIRVLVIDDDLIQQRITREMFSQNHVVCDCCTHTWELTDLLKKNNYDLLLTDIQMPEVDGFGILEILRSSNIEKNKNIPIIAVTARPDDDNEYLSRGFAGSIHKPFTIEQLMNIAGKTVCQKEVTDQLPDFSVILSGEDNRQEMLRLFIEETRKDIVSIVAAIDQNDLKTVHSILHKNLPLWETVHINYPLVRLKKMVTTATDSWTKEQIADIQEIIRSVKELIEIAEHKLQEENK